MDLVPYKTCSFDCIYCQIGRTTNKTSERKEYVPLEEVVAQLKEKLPSKPDYITLSGSGEPTLYSRLGELISEIKSMTDTPVAILTNGSTLWLPEVRESIIEADLLVPSLDAGNEEVFRKVNRPCDEITFDKLVEGLISFRKEYVGEYNLEVFLIEGINSSTEQASEIAKLTASIKPDRAQLNTVARPPAEDYAMGVSSDRLEELLPLFGEDAEIIADFSRKQLDSTAAAVCDDVEQMVARRPCSVNDIANGLGISVNEVVKYVDKLTRDGKIIPVKTDKGIFYQGER